MSLLLNNKRRKSQSSNTDPYANNVVLFLKGDGTNGSTNIIDSSPTPKTMSVFGNAQISTAQSKYGGSSLLFDGNGDYLTTPTSSSFNFGTSTDFTIESWIYPQDNTDVVIYSSQGLSFVLNVTTGCLRLYTANGTNIVDGNTTITPNTWTHVAVTRNSGTARFFINGFLDKSFSYSVFGTNNTIFIGKYWELDVAFWTGYIDSLRVTNIARYTSAFNPETDTYLNV